jgi:tRNA-Thr(GGU) m(6)t(6)A37 methyltransferase TsaA
MEGILLEPIGIIRTPFKDKYAAPRQPFSEGIVASGKVVLSSGYNFEQALADLDGFEKIWLIYQFDRNKNWKPKVLPPRGSQIKRGVFATRSPHRPNPIGLSVVTLVEINRRTIYIDGVDMLDKTPLFDIKPYLPGVESFPDAKTGWVEVEKKEAPFRTILYPAEIEAFLSSVSPTIAKEIRAHIEHSLRYDITPHPYKRRTRSENGSFILAFKSWRIQFTIQDSLSVVIHGIQNNE